MHPSSLWALVGLCLAGTGCLIDRSSLSSGAPRPGDDAGQDASIEPGDATAPDARVEDGGRLDPDSGRGDADLDRDSGSGDAGSDAGPCPDGPTGTEICPFTTLAQLAGVPAGTYQFVMAALAFQAEVDDREGGGWILIASADETTMGRARLSRTTTGPVVRQSHDIFAPEVVAALPDAREVRIDSSTGSAVVASVTSTDGYVLGQLRSYRSLHAVPAEPGANRWSGGDAGRMTSTCSNVAPEALDRLVFQTCGAGGDNLHWGPDPSGLGDPADRLNSWVYRSGRRDRLNLWVRH